MDAQRFFRDDYFGARELFVSTCRRAGLSLETHTHPLAGPSGEALSTDCVLIGRQDAPKLMVLISGTHGVELLSGSACQTGFIATGLWQSLKDDTAILVIHALNCWGAAHRRRNTEGNVDLSRNFLDFDEPLPVNAAYEGIHAAVSCEEYRGVARDRANQALADYREAHGADRYVAAMMGGQYRHPDGMCYGGDKPVWSNKLLMSALTPFRETAESVSVVEYHSGLGPYGYGMAVTMQTGDELSRARSIYGRWVEAPNERGEHGDEQYFRVNGHPTEGFRRALPDSDLTAVVLEFGTYPPMVSLPVLLDDHWLTRFGDLDSAAGLEIKARLIEMHHPADPDWRQAVWDRSVQVIQQTFRGLD